jgi:hypothetical protein
MDTKHQAMTAAKANAIVATAYNLHIAEGDPMTPEKASALTRGDRAALCRILQIKGGSDLYSQKDAEQAFVFVVA